MNSSKPSHPLKEAFRLGWGGAKSNLVPGAVLWAVGLVLVISYYQFENVSVAIDHVGRWKERFSPWFAILSTAIFGSLIPWLAQGLFSTKDPNKKGGQPFRKVPWLFLFWAIHGWQVDQLYRFQSLLFGNELTASTIVAKTLVDQFLWSPFLATPQVLLFYLFSENEHSGRRFREALKRKGFLQRLIPLLLTNWMVWIPSVALIYLFPLPLQLPLMNLILASWCLIVIFFAKNG